MYCHLVSVEIGIERGADQRVQLNRFAFNQDRFKGLDTQTVKGGGPVEHDRVFLNNFL